VPVCEVGSSDEVWNGLALCPNHHTLFDARSFVVGVDLIVHVDLPTVTFLRESNRAEGLEILTDYEGSRIRPPHLWEAGGVLRTRMMNAFDQRYALSGIAGG